jgi:hypothetical protein
MKYTAIMIGKKLEDELKSGYDVIRVARVAAHIYHEHCRDLSPELDEIVLSLMAMEEGPEFEYNEEELWDLRRRLARM